MTPPDLRQNNVEDDVRAALQEVVDAADSAYDWRSWSTFGREGAARLARAFWLAEKALDSRADDRPDLWHRPAPGPLYWDWRCTRCGEAVKDHPSWLARMRRRFA